MPFGYNGKILHVNLTAGTWEIEEPGEKFYKTYVGGSSLASYYLLKHIQPGVDPLSAENVLVFACSVVTGAPLSGFSRYTVAAKSPLTGAFGETEAGGYFGPELKFAGLDAVVFYGRSPKPVYLWVHNGEVELRDAAGVWGKDNWETLEGLRAELGEKRIRVASIGPAGENLIPFACVQNDLEHYNGRTGMGAVMGAKNLKAVVARGSSKNLTFADPEKVKEIRKWHNERIKVHPPNAGLTKVGTSGLVKGLNDTGILPTHNFRDGVFAGADKIDANALHTTIFHSAGTCYACAVKCKRRVASDDPKYPLDSRFGGPEYETLGALGSLIDNDNLPALARGNQLCNLYGLDSISTGCVIAFAMECYENGILTEAEVGRPIPFGDADAMLWMIEEIAHQRGIGKILAQGVKKAAGLIGKGAERYAFHIKGQELPLHDGRGKTGMGMGFALSPTGADHIETPHDVAFQGDGVSKLSALGLHEPVNPLTTDAAKVRFFYLGQRAWGINNCYGLCNFTSVPIHAMTFERLVEVIRAITGWDTSLFDVMAVSERSNVMARVFNNREGFTPKEDRIIRRWHEPMPDGPIKGQYIDREEFKTAIALYYEMAGWDAEGKPTRAKLVELGLEWLAN